MNDAHLKVAGRTREDQIGTRLFDAFPDDPNDPDADGVRNLTASLERVVATRAADTMAIQRYSVKGADGTFIERWWAPTNTPIFGEGGEVELIVHHAEDVTEVIQLRGDAEGRDQLARSQQAVIDRLRASEAAVRESEARRDAALGVARLGTFDWELGSGAVVLDPRSRDIFGFSHHEVLTAAQVFGRIHPDDLPRTKAAADTAAARGEHLSIDYRIVLPGGEIRTILSDGGPLLGSDGSTERMVGVFADISDQKRAEADLRASEARFRLMANAVPQIVWITDSEGRAEFFNKQWSDYTGAAYEPTTAAEIAVKHLHPDDAEATMEAFDEARRTGTTFLIEHRIRSKDGEWRWFLVRGEPHRDPSSGEVIHWFGASVDIHDRKEAEVKRDALLELNDRLQAADGIAEMSFTASEVVGRTLNATSAGYGTMDADMDGLVIERNWAAPGIPGIAGRYRMQDYGSYSPELRLGRDVVIPDVRLDPRTSETAAGLESVGGRAFVNIPIMERGRFVALFFVLSTTPRQWSDDELAFIREVADRTRSTVERRRAEDELRHFATTLEQRVAERTADRNRMWQLSTEIMVVASFEGIIKAVNPAWTKVLQWTDTSVVGESFMDLIHPDDREATAKEVAKLSAGETTFRFENRYRMMDGNYRYISWTAVPGDGLIHAVGRDVSDERARDAELQIAQDALRQSQKMEAMGQLTGGVAHDFNNLLTPIVGSLDMLQRKGLGSEREQRLIAGAMQSADRAKTLVQRLLAFARRQPLQASAVNVGGLVTGMADLIASTTGPQIRVVVETADSLPPAKADANQLEMALLNLGVNARDAMPEGGTLRITAGTERVGAGHRSNLKNGEYVRLSVADTGVGMDEATIKRAVEPFFSTKGVGKGTGLGLSMVHGLVSQLGGGLTIDSRAGVGTNVELWLPVSEAREEPAKPADTAVHVPVVKGTVLLVDDEELVRVSTADMLEDLGYGVVEAASAEQALALLQEGLRPDLLVTDHLMPGMNGTELAHAVRSDRLAAQILIVSGYAENDGVDPALPRLTKPFRSTELAAKLSELASAGST